jgi:hypothetical protein
MALQHPLKSGSVTRNAAAVFSNNACIVGNPSVTRPNGQRWGKVRIARQPFRECRVPSNLGERVDDLAQTETDYGRACYGLCE